MGGWDGGVGWLQALQRKKYARRGRELASGASILRTSSSFICKRHPAQGEIYAAAIWE